MSEYNNCGWVKKKNNLYNIYRLNGTLQNVNYYTTKNKKNLNGWLRTKKIIYKKIIVNMAYYKSKYYIAKNK